MNPDTSTRNLQIAGAYGVLGLLLYFEQDDLLFPAPKTYEKANPADAHLPFEDLHKRVVDSSGRTYQIRSG